MTMKHIKHISLISCITFVGFFAACDSTPKSDIELLISLSTYEVNAITHTTANSGGNITSDGGSEILARGVCWSTKPNPTIADSKTMDGVGIGRFTSAIEGLTTATTYYVRAYATSTLGTAYGNIYQIRTRSENVIPTTLNPDLSYGVVYDIDGNVYNTITIGTQTWMAENLRTTRYRSGESVPLVTNSSTWATVSNDAQCTYDNMTNVDTIAKIGRLYNFKAVSDSRNLAPVGWHIATDTEWIVLTSYLAGHLESSFSIINKMSSKIGWTPYIDGDDFGLFPDNSSGFSALPCGIRDNNGLFYDHHDATCWWAFTPYDAVSA